MNDFNPFRYESILTAYQKWLENDFPIFFFYEGQRKNMVWLKGQTI